MLNKESENKKRLNYKKIRKKEFQKKFIKEWKKLQHLRTFKF